MFRYCSSPFVFRARWALVVASVALSLLDADHLAAAQSCALGEQECGTQSASDDLTLLALHTSVEKEVRHVREKSPLLVEKDTLEAVGTATGLHNARAVLLGAVADRETSVVLLGSLGFIMMLFYMVNSHMKIVVTSTWSIITAAVSIFCAVLIQGVTNKVVISVLGLKEPEEFKPPGIEHIAASALQLLVWWLVVVWVLFAVRGNLLRLKGYGTIGGHLLGFAAVRLCGQLATSTFFRGTHWQTLFVIIIYSVLVACLFKITHVLYQSVRSADGDSEQREDEQWHEQYKDTITDFFCIGVAFLLCLWIRFVIVGARTGHVPSTGKVSSSHLGEEVWTLGIFGVWLLVVAGLLARVHHQVSQRDFAWMADVATTTTSLAAAFCLLWCANWYFYGFMKASLMEHVAVALLFSGAAIKFIFFISAVMHHGRAEKRFVRGIFTGVSLVVGMSWEKVFDACLESLGNFGSSEKGTEAIVFIAPVALFCIVLPAWMTYMLPRSDEKLSAQHSLKRGNLPFWAMCCDCLYNPFEDD